MLARLFSPISVGTIELKNRIVMGPMTTRWACEDGTPSERLIDFWEARARGGAAMIITETLTVDERFPYQDRPLGIYRDEHIPQFKAAADRIHAAGAKLAPQIMHPGPDSSSFRQGIQPIGPSSFLCRSNDQVCRELSVIEIAGIIEQFAVTCRRVRDAGCDAVEVHAAHAYTLVGGFLSPLRNRRTDDYGGSSHNRVRFAQEVVRAIKAEAGSDFPVIMRISGDEHVDGGRDLLETLYMIPELCDAGVDAFEVSGGVFPEGASRIQPLMTMPLGINVPEASAIKRASRVPVMVVGRIKDVSYAEGVLEKGEADAVVMARALLADPELPNKALAGRLDDIAPCVSCGLGCLARRRQGKPLTCVINPTVGREREMIMIPAARRKKVMVIGGGPAGLEAARVAALRGHAVSLVEKKRELGGEFALGTVPPSKRDYAPWAVYLINQVRRLGVRVDLGKEATSEAVSLAKPDVLIVAASGRSADILRKQTIGGVSEVHVLDDPKAPGEVLEAVAAASELAREI